MDGEDLEKSPVIMVEAHGGFGGPPTTLLHLAPELARTRRVTVVIPPGPVSERLENAGIDVVSLPHWQRQRPTRKLAQSVVTVHRAMNKRRGAIVHLNGKSAVSIAGPSLAVSRRPAIVHFHDYDLDARAGRRLRWLNHSARLRWAPVSEQARSVLNNAGVTSTQTETIPNPIAQPLSRHRAPGPPWTIVFSTGADPRKGFDIMVELAGKLRALPIKWHVYGALLHPSDFILGCLDRADELAVADRIELHTLDPQFAAVLGRFHACLIASRRESFCRVALEAMAAGTPVIAGRIPGLDEAVGEGSCHLYDLDDLDGAASALRQVLERPTMSESMVSAGRQRSAHFSPTEIAKSFEKEYAQLARR